MKELFVIMLSAVFVDNFVLSKFMGICPFLGVSKKLSSSLGMGAAVIFVMTCATAITYPVYKLILVPNGLEYLNTVAFILIIASLVQLIEMFLRKFVPALYGALGIYLPLITTNCAVLGAALLNIQNGYNFIESLAYGFASAVGFTLAIVIFAGVRVRISFAEPPKSFRGTPIALIAAGLIAMAFSGFSGMSF